jgi:cyclopropane-fatty-acyl-phospholipid synthase
VLDAILTRRIKSGSLSVTWPNGRTSRYGESGSPGCEVAVRLVGRLTPIRLHPDLYLGQAYMDGTLRLERGSLWDLMNLLCRNIAVRRDRPMLRVVRPLFNRLIQHNSRGTPRKNVAHHYDLSDDLYRLFLDQDLRYSCAYFSVPDLK